MGAVAVALVSNIPSEELRGVIADVTFSSSYATGGDTVPLGKLGLTEVIETWVHSGNTAPDTGRTTGFAPNVHGVQAVLVGTRAVPKLKAVVGVAGTPAEVANATNLSAVPAVRILFRGH